MPETKSNMMIGDVKNAKYDISKTEAEKVLGINWDEKRDASYNGM